MLIDYAYSLVFTGRTKTAILSPNVKMDVKVDVDVKNTCAPFDSQIVKAWHTASNGFGREFIFEDGPGGDEISLNYDDVRQQALDES